MSILTASPLFSLTFVEIVIAYAGSDCPSSLDPNDPSWKYFGTSTTNSSCIYSEDNCFSSVCKNATAIQSQFILLDYRREQRMQVGRGKDINSLVIIPLRNDKVIMKCKRNDNSIGKFKAIAIQ